MSTQGSKTSKSGGISKAQFENFYSVAPKGTKRQTVEELVKRNNGDIEKINLEIDALWNIEDNQQQKSNQNSDGGWTDVKKKTKSASNRKSDQRQSNTGRGRGQPRRQQDSNRGRAQPNDKSRSVNTRAARKPAPVQRQPAPVPQKVPEIQPQDDVKESNPADKAPLKEATPTSSFGTKNSWAGGVSFSERFKRQEEEKKKIAERTKASIQNKNKQSPEQSVEQNAKSPEEQAKANEQAFPSLQSKGKGTTVDATGEAADENTAAPTNVAVSWAKKAMQPPKPKASTTPAATEKPQKTEAKEPARAPKSSSTPEQNLKSTAPAKAVAPKAPAPAAQTAAVPKPPVSTKAAPAKKASPVKEPVKKQPSSPGSYVKLPAGFAEENSFSFGGFALESNQKQDAPVQIGAWGAVASSKPTETTEPKSASDKSNKALDSPQKDLISELMASPQSDTAQIRRPVAENVAVNAADYESQARAKADAAAANIKLEQAKKEAEPVAQAPKPAAASQVQQPSQSLSSQQNFQQNYPAQQQSRFNNAQQQQQQQGKRKPAKNNMRSNAKQQQFTNQRGQANASSVPGQTYPEGTQSYPDNMYQYSQPSAYPTMQDPTYPNFPGYSAQPNAGLESQYYKQPQQHGFNQPPPGMEGAQPNEGSNDMSRQTGDSNQLGGQHAQQQNVRHNVQQQNAPVQQQQSTNANAGANPPPAANPAYGSSHTPPPQYPTHQSFANTPPGMTHPYPVPYPHHHQYYPQFQYNYQYQQAAAARTQMQYQRQQPMYEPSGQNFGYDQHQYFDQNFQQQNIAGNPSDQQADSSNAGHQSVMDGNAQAKAGVGGVANQSASGPPFSQHQSYQQSNFSQPPGYGNFVMHPNHPQIHHQQYPQQGQQQQQQYNQRNTTGNNNWGH